MAPRLAILSGYPGSGKSTVSRFFTLELGYFRLSSDETREMLFQRDYMELKQLPERGYLESEILFPLTDGAKAVLLYRGHDIVIDSSAPNNITRQYLLNTKYSGGEINAEKALIILDVERQILMRRPHPDALEEWENMWEQPVEGDYEIIRYWNNSENDLKKIKDDLRIRFPHRTPLALQKRE